MTRKILITGGSGFFGGVLKRRLLAEGHTVHNIDLVADADTHPALGSTKGDIRDAGLLRAIFQHGSFDAVFHCAAQLAHDTIDSAMLWTSNVDGTRNIAEACGEFGVPKLINISTNCLWASNLGREVAEDEPPAPVELYGKSKLAAEELLKEYESANLQIVTIRCPTIIDSGRLGLLAILFEFIQDNRKVWVVGSGGNRNSLHPMPRLSALRPVSHWQRERRFARPGLPVCDRRGGNARAGCAPAQGADDLRDEAGA
jgi:nucleoside-diphosphate-sugar epimerase